MKSVELLLKDIETDKYVKELSECKIMFNDINGYFNLLSLTTKSNKEQKICLSFKSFFVSISSINFMFNAPYKAGLFLIFNFKKYVALFKELLIDNNKDNYIQIMKNFAKDINMRFKESGDFPNKIYTFS